MKIIRSAQLRFLQEATVGELRAALRHVPDHAALSIHKDIPKNPTPLDQGGVVTITAEWEADLAEPDPGEFQESPKRPRRRVNDALLKQVAETYRGAWADDTPPTQAVADYFNRPHSTAARWVGEARRRGFLAPSDGSRGGEVESDPE